MLAMALGNFFVAVLAKGKITVISTFGSINRPLEAERTGAWKEGIGLHALWKGVRDHCPEERH